MDPNVSRDHAVQSKNLTNFIYIQSRYVGNTRKEDAAKPLPSDGQVIDEAVVVLVHQSGQLI